MVVTNMPDSFIVLRMGHRRLEREALGFKSFEETIVLVATLVAFGVGYKVFKGSLLTSSLIGMLSAFVVAYVTFSEFALRDGVITYRNRFRETTFPLSSVEKAGMSTFWAGLSGPTFIFVMRSPPAAVNGHFMRTGLISWPSASAWIEAVNASIRQSQIGKPL
jgi:hypothetical protein